MFKNKLKSKISQLKEKHENDSISSIIETIKIDEETRNERFNMCISCEHLFKLTNTCKKCGCFMTAKTWLKNASCPIKKW